MSFTPQQVNALLPQTQCRECSYAGCEPYAVAIATQQERIDRCPPGGIATLKKLADLTGQDATPYLADMQAKARPPQVAIIREAECIGCTKCIQACPVDAIIGSAKHMHSVFSKECTGCGLCIPACPVDCIDLQVLTQAQYDVNVAKQRYENRQVRLTKEKQTKFASRVATKEEQALADKRAAIQAAVARAKQKRQL